MINVSNDDVANALIDHRHIEAAVLCKTRQEAESIAYTRSYDNVRDCFTPDGCRLWEV
jgi:hypothetical protein